jgi:hypothetical protein
MAAVGRSIGPLSAARNSCNGLLTAYFFVLRGRSHVRVFDRRRRVRRASPTATLRHLASLRPSPDIHVRSFGRFYEITYLVEKTSDLTLPDFVRCHFRVAIAPAKSRLRLPVTQIYTLPPNILRLAGPFGLLPSPGDGESAARRPLLT